MSSTCDTSVLVPALAAWHGAHETARSALSTVGVLGSHVLLETYSVLTRLPGGHRIEAATAAAALDALSWDVLDLPTRERTGLIQRLAAERIVGGAVYDALVGLTARHHGLVLLTRDRRAQRTYRALDVRFEIV